LPHDRRRTRTFWRIIELSCTYNGRGNHTDYCRPTNHALTELHC
jgi:hypothetical protein